MFKLCKFFIGSSTLEETWGTKSKPIEIRKSESEATISLNDGFIGMIGVNINNIIVATLSFSKVLPS